MELKKRSWYSWLVVGLLWGVALLNYMDRQMQSTMKPVMMVNISELQTAENFGRLLAIFLWIYGLMNMTGVFAGALITEWPGKSTDAGNLGRDLALLAIPVIAALILILAFLRPETADKTED